MNLETIIGLEIHIELKTQSKMFCACPNELSRGGEPNSQVCPICLGQPGTLPSLNREAVERALRLVVALNCEVPEVSVFARKHYTYPDLPKGYQISQYDKPLAVHGFLNIDDEKKIALERLHLEEDTAKSIHEKNGATLINHNRAGVPLLELVTKPVLQSGAEARIFVQKLQALVRLLGVSDADMQNGHLRVDANISLRPVNETKLFPKTEIKNLNSTKSVQLALEYEEKRQSKLWNKDQAPQNMSTRGWNEIKKETFLQRDKEEAKDYRYFPEPDLLPLKILATELEKIKEQVESMVGAQAQESSSRADFKTRYNFSDKDLTKVPVIFQPLFDRAVDLVLAKMEGQGDASVGEDQKIAVARRWLGLMDKMKAFTSGFEADFFETRLPYLADLLEKFIKREITSSQLQAGVEKVSLAKESELSTISTELGDLSAETLDYDALARQVVSQYPELVEQYKKGKVAVIKFLLGSMIKASKGSAQAGPAEDALKKILHQK